MRVERLLLVAWRQSERCAKRLFRIPTFLGYIADFQFIHYSLGFRMGQSHATWSSLEPRDRVIFQAGNTFIACRLFEDALLYLLSELDSSSADAQREKNFEQSWDFHSTKTLGRLLGRLKDVAELPPDFEATLTNCITERNRFVHGFLRDINWEYFIQEGKDLECERLQEIRRVLYSGTKALQLKFKRV